MATQITTYGSKGQKLSFRDTIANVFPVDTPIYSSAKNGSASAKLHQWQEETLDTPGQNASVEGAAKAAEEQVVTTELSSSTQNFEKLASVTDSNEAIGKYGRKSDLARQEMLKGKAIMNDIEYAYGHSQAGSAGSSSTRRSMTSFNNQLNAAVVVNAAGDTAGLTEARMLAAHQATFNAGGDPSLFIVPSSQGTNIASWSTTADAVSDAGSRIRDFGNSKELVNCVELLVTPYGRMKVVLSRYQQDQGYDASADTGGNSGTTALSGTDDGIALLVDPEYVENAELRSLRRKRLATSGASESTLIDCELTLAVLNSRAHAVVRGFKIA